MNATLSASILLAGGTLLGHRTAIADDSVATSKIWNRTNRPIG